METYTRGRLIGRGSSATVSLATSSTGELFAIKSAATHHPNTHHLQTEQTILSSIPPSPYIITYKGHHHTTTTSPSTTFNIFMEYLPHGSLSDEITRRGKTLVDHSFTLLQLYTWRILKGLHHLHTTAGIIHCDIKPTNILIGKSGPKIADFGCARSITDVSLKTTRFSGTPVYMAPEVARGENQGPYSDIWSFGCTVVEMVTGRPPWKVTDDGGDVMSFLYRVGYGLMGERPELPELLSEEGRDFIDKCLRRRPEERWTTTMLLQHPFVRGFEGRLDGIELNGEEDGIEIDKCDINCCSSSPTSVLQQQGTWSSECELDDEPGRQTVEDRIRGLLVEASSSSLVVEMWESEDEDWITVRGIGQN